MTYLTYHVKICFMDLVIEKILNSVEKPYRYSGAELCLPVIDDQTRIRTCLCMPSLYEDAMKKVNDMVVYYMLNDRKGYSCERCFAPWLDMARHEYEHSVKAKPMIHEYLAELKKQNVRIGMATSSNPYLLEPVMKSNGLDQYFDEICYTSEVGKNKANPDIYLYTAEKLGVQPNECVVFEDIPEGISGAGKAGMRTVVVYDKASEENIDALKKSADRFIMSFGEMLGVDIWKETE